MGRGVLSCCCSPDSPQLDLHRALSVEDVLASRLVRPVGRVTQVFSDGTLLLELVRPPNGPFGFVISRGKGRPDTGNVNNKKKCYLYRKYNKLLHTIFLQCVFRILKFESQNYYVQFDFIEIIYRFIYTANQEKNVQKKNTINRKICFVSIQLY